jgi:hypothetical protein
MASLQGVATPQQLLLRLHSAPGNWDGDLVPHGGTGGRSASARYIRARTPYSPCGLCFEQVQGVVGVAASDAAMDAAGTGLGLGLAVWAVWREYVKSISESALRPAET